MGAWGYGILESDNALDMEADLLDQLSYNYNLPEEMRIKNALEQAENMEKMLQYAQSMNTEFDDGIDKAIAYQVLMTILMKNGAKIRQDYFDEIVTGIKGGEYQLVGETFLKKGRLEIKDLPEGYDEDSIEWFEGRIKAILILLEISNKYDINGGTPLDIPNEGLFEKILKQKM